MIRVSLSGIITDLDFTNKSKTEFVKMTGIVSSYKQMPVMTVAMHSLIKKD